MRNAFRVPDGVRYRHRATLRDAKKGEALNVCRIDDGFEIVHQTLKGNVGDLAVGQSIAAGIVAIDGMIA